MKLQRKIVYYIILFVFASSLLTWFSIGLYNYRELSGGEIPGSFVNSMLLGLAVVVLATIASMVFSWLGFRRWFVSLPVIKRSSINSLKDSEQKANAVLENIIDGILTIDSKGIVHSMNPAAENIFGIAAGKVIGKNVRMLMPEPYSSQHDGYLKHYLDTGEKRIIGLGREVYGLRSNGREFPMELSVSEIKIGKERMFTGIVRDITDRKFMEDVIRDSEEKANSVLETIVDGIITIDNKGLVRSMNPAAEKIFGFSLREVEGENVNMLMPEPYSSQHDEFLRHYLETGEKKVIGIGREVVGLRRDGTQFPMELAVSEMSIRGQRMFTGIVRDITEKKMLEESIKKMAMHDALTGLPNRNLLNERVKQAIALFKRSRQHFSVMLVDIDGFKPVNDTYGHDAGDAVLVEIAQRFQSVVRETDMVARIGGDEFLLLLCLGPEKEGVARVAGEILKSLTAPIPYKEHECHVGASIGLALYPENGSNLDELFKSADEAMYKVKKAGKNNFGFA